MVEQELKEDDEENEGLANDDLFNITSWGADLSFRELISMYKEKDIEKPELQRNYVWTKLEASRFIESILMGLPVPSIFLANKPESNKKLIVDGYQRLMSVYDFVENGIFSGDNSIFALSNSKKINYRWRNRTFKQLSEDEQRKIRTTTIHAIVFEQKEPKDKDTSLFQIFERINTGGRALNAQEIRNCIYQGEFNSALMKCNKYLAWRQLYENNQDVSEDVLDNRMIDIEYILRYAALVHTDLINLKKNQIGLKLFLNDFMHNTPKDIFEPLLEKFKNNMNFIATHIGLNAFRNYNFEEQRDTNKFHATIFDSIAIATTLYKDEKIQDLPKRRLNLLQDEGYKQFISTRTTNVNNIINRINIAANYLYDKNLPIKDVE